MSRGIYGSARVGEVTDAGVLGLKRGIADAGALVALGLIGAALIKRLTKVQIANRTVHPSLKF